MSIEELKQKVAESKVKWQELKEKAHDYKMKDLLDKNDLELKEDESINDQNKQKIIKWL